MKRKKPLDKSAYQALAMITQFGINMIVPIGMMSALGIWLDRKQGTSFWTLLLFFVGAVAGAQNIYRMARKVYDRKTPEEVLDAAGPDGDSDEPDGSMGEVGGRIGETAGGIEKKE